MIHNANDYIEAIQSLWTEYTKEETGISQGLKDILNKSYAIPNDYHQSDLMIAGINPSVDSEWENKPCLYSTSRVLNGKRFWNSIVSLVPESYRETYVHADLFVLKQTAEAYLSTIHSAQDLQFMAKHLFLTQQLIENVIRPKLIVVLNKASWAYWGYDSRYDWLGYKFKTVREIRKNVILTEIEGLDMGKSGMVTPPELREQRRELMKGTKVLFARFQSNGCPGEQKVTADEIQQILVNDCQ